MVARLVGSGDQVGRGRDQVVDHNQDLVALDAERRAIAGLRADGEDFLGDGGAQAAGADGVCELGFVQFHVAAHDAEDELLGKLAAGLFDLGNHEDGLGGFRFGDAKEGGQAGDGFGVRRRHLFEGQRRSHRRRGLAEGGDLAVGAVAAFVAEHERILADGRKGHVFVGHRAAHHADVGAYGDHVDVAAVEDVVIGLVKVRVIRIQAGVVTIKRVGILHRKFAHADDAGAGARLVAELGLNLVKHGGELAIAADKALRHVGHDLLVGHGEHHVTAGAVFETRQVRADGLPAAGFLPEFSRMDDGEGDFLAANGIHLVAKNVFDLMLDAQGKRQQIKDAGGDLVDHAGAQQELVADNVGIGRNFTQCLKKEF